MFTDMLYICMDSSVCDSEHGVVLSLFDQTGNMVRPWAEAGYECIAVDIQNDGTTEEHVGDGVIYHVEADVREYLPPRTTFRIAFAFPPCTNLAVSGARWFEQKGIDGLADGLELVERAKRLLEWTDAPWMLENPVSTISTYWREPDYTFHPYEFDPYTDADETYRKKTCLWTDGDYEMPSAHPDSPTDGDSRIHAMPPSDDRGEKRAQTPTGFARAVFEANQTVDVKSGTDSSDTRGEDIDSITVPDGVRKRDEVWLAVLNRLQTQPKLTKSEIISEVAASEGTIYDVLSGMAEADLLNHTPGSRYWRRSHALSQIVGHPTPS
jgi:hypothetical protein